MQSASSKKAVSSEQQQLSERKNAPVPASPRRISQVRDDSFTRAKEETAQPIFCLKLSKNAPY